MQPANRRTMQPRIEPARSAAAPAAGAIPGTRRVVLTLLLAALLPGSSAYARALDPLAGAPSSADGLIAGGASGAAAPLAGFVYGGPPTPFIDLGGLTPCECRQPSVMATTVEEGRSRLGCRQLKLVQHWLNAMVAEPRYRAKRTYLGDPEEGTLDLSGPENVERRQQYFFGEFWSTFAANSVPQEDAIKDFDGDLRDAFPRMTAVLIASTHPVDRDDAFAGDQWWWELPEPYRSIDDLDERAAVMRQDVNEWIQKSGLWIYADAGTDSGGLVLSAPEGDFDFILSRLIAFMYRFKDHPELVDDVSMEVLIRKSWPEKQDTKVANTAWTPTNVPFSGQEYELELTYNPSLTVFLAETENHVLMTLVHYFLMNQWIANGFRGTPDDPGNGAIDDPDAWFSATKGPLYDKVRDVLARVVHQGMFEENATPYQHYSFHALLTFSTFAEDPIIAAEAKNAVLFLVTRFAFQSLDGRRWAPMRRNCAYADSLDLYGGVALAVGALSGAYKWNDSPYGYRLTAADSGACFDEAAVSDCASCFWHTYTWKSDLGPDYDPDDGPQPDDSAGENVTFDSTELANDLPDTGTGLAIALDAAFSRFVIPATVHGFLIRKHDGYLARMTSQYDRDHYPIGLVPPVFPSYFSGDEAIDGKTDNERTPELYFAGNGFLNVAGGIYNTLYESALGGEGTAYNIPANPFPPITSTCTDKNPAVEQYDNLSRPYTVLSQVPQATEPFTDRSYYRPYLLHGGLERVRPEQPLMRGFGERWYKSANVATYKNFSYGYRTGLGPDVLAEWEITTPLDLCLWVPTVYEKLDMEFPHDLPDEWLQSKAVPKTSFSIGMAAFRVYDTCEWHEQRGQTGYYLVTARVRKKSLDPWSRKVSRGFWEAVPCDGPYGSLAEVASAVKHLNKKEWFPSKYLLDADKHYQYRLATTREYVRLSQYYGAQFLNCGIADPTNEGRTQGIIQIKDADGNDIPMADVFLRFMSNGLMNELPLIDVKAVDEGYDFILGQNGQYRYYACARDGWLAVDDFVDGTYLFVDSRRGPGLSDDPEHPTPYWEEGVFTDATPWGVACGYGGEGTWNPAPPDNGKPTDCAYPELCPADPHDPGPGDPGGNPPGGGHPGDGEHPDLFPRTACVKHDPFGVPHQLNVDVRNAGPGAAGASTTRVEFADGTVHLVPTPALAVGAMHQFGIALPDACLGAAGSCAFTVVADSADVLDETDEANNEREDVCAS